MFSPIFIIILIGFILLNIPYRINYDFFISMKINTDYMISMPDDPHTIKGTLDVNNLKIEKLDVAVEKVRDGAIYIGGMAAAAKAIKNSSFPIGAKQGSVLGMGAASLISYKKVQNNLGHKTETLKLKAENISTIVTGSKSNCSNDTINKFVEGVGNSNGDTGNYVISLLDLEQLQLDF